MEPGFVLQAIQNGQHKGRRLARARLCSSQKIFSGENVGDGLGLNGCGFDISSGANPSNDKMRQTEFRKRHIDS